MNVQIDVIGSDRDDARITLRAIAKAFGLQTSRRASGATIISALKKKMPGCVVNAAV